MTGNRHRYLRGVALGAVAALALASCNRPGRPPKPTTTTAPKPTTTMSHGGMDHGNMPARLDHDPTEEQKAAALKFVDDTRKAVQEDGLTLEKIKQMHYINIGDGVHYVKPEYTRDEYYLDPHHIESFAVFGGQLAAAMYVYNPKGKDTTLDDVPDIAGNWTMWHDHVLPYASDDPTSDDFFKLKIGGVSRHDSPMIHVWMKPNKCGPWASAGVGEGSCIKELATY
jgi:hypothetical protein